MNESLCEARQGRAMRESASESIQISLTCTPPFTASMNERSNVALCATTGQPPTKSLSAATASTAEGALVTSALVILVSFVISAGIRPVGCTKVSNVSTISRPRRRAAEISISSQSWSESPVVSVSSTITSSSISAKSRVFARSSSDAYDSITNAGVPGTTASSISMQPPHGPTPSGPDRRRSRQMSFRYASPRLDRVRYRSYLEWCWSRG